MKAAANLVVDPAPPHVFEGGGHHGQQPVLAGLEINLQQQIDGAGVGKLGGVAEAAVLRIEHAADAFDDRLENFSPAGASSILEMFHPGQRLGDFRALSRIWSRCVR